MTLAATVLVTPGSRRAGHRVRAHGGSGSDTHFSSYGVGLDVSESTGAAVADHVVVEFGAPEGEEEWVIDALAEQSYTGYLRRVHAGPVAPGDRWSEFVSRGCGGTRDVILTVVSVDGGDAIGSRTTFSFRAADG